MSFLDRLFGRRDRRRALEPLYAAIVAAGRDPYWYRHGGVADSVDGRFDVIAALTALVLLRLEAEGEAGREPAVALTEAFIADMDASLRQIGIGDYVVGKHIGRLMSALGGRLGAFRQAAGDEAFAAAIRRNLFDDAPPSEEAAARAAARLAGLREALAALPLAQLLEGRLA